MAEKNLLSRIVHKHDIETNWNKATNFIPKQGELIVYDVDSTFNYPRFKIGDGTTNVINLPFSTENLESKIEELENRVEEVELVATDIQSDVQKYETKPNLLDNWYFVGGGTAGTFPINQRGKTSYAGAVENIDKWYSSNSRGIVQTLADCLLLTNNGAGTSFLRQDFGMLTDGTTYTLSLLVKADTADGYIATFENVSVDKNNVTYFDVLSDWSLVTLTFTPTANAPVGQVAIRCAQSGNTWLKAIKLERGDTQTLAHQDSSGKWVLNETPNYAEEWQKCRVYYQPNPENILDNSNFEVAQAGYKGKHGTSFYACDRWHIISGQQNATITKAANALTVAASSAGMVYMRQRIAEHERLLGKACTLAMKTTDGTIKCANVTYPKALGDGEVGRIQFSDGIYFGTFTDSEGFHCQIRLNAGYSISLEWLAIYEGRYTAKTLPAYVPKGYAVELEACQREFKLPVVNLLDNSDFTNLVNQRGGESGTTTAWGYFVDRWIARSTGTNFSFDDNGMQLSSAETANVFVYQKIAKNDSLLGKTVTAAVCAGTGEIIVATAALPTELTTTWTTFKTAKGTNGETLQITSLGTSSDPLAVCIGRDTNLTDTTVTFRWVALYEGAYTVETLPPYTPKGYAVELAACRLEYKSPEYNGDTIMGAATASAAGTPGQVPAPAAGKQNSYLRGDATWAIPSASDVGALALSGGTITGDLKVNGVLTTTKLGTASVGSATQPMYLAAGVPTACTYTLGKSVPSNAVFTDTVYTHPTNSGNKHIPSGGSSGQILRWSADGTATWGADNNTTYSAATTSAAGLMSAADKRKLNDIAAGAQVNTITGIKGNSETSYRTGNVNLTAANIGAAASSHNHSAANITSGTLAISRGGTNATTGLAGLNNLATGTSEASPFKIMGSDNSFCSAFQASGISFFRGYSADGSKMTGLSLSANGGIASIEKYSTTGGYTSSVIITTGNFAFSNGVLTIVM